MYTNKGKCISEYTMGEYMSGVHDIALNYFKNSGISTWKDSQIFTMAVIEYPGAPHPFVVNLL